MQPNTKTKAVKPNLDAPFSNEGKQDWHLLITQGHVCGHRTLEVGKRLFPVAAAITLAGLWLVGSALYSGTTGQGGAPESIVRALTSTPNTAALPGSDDKANFRLAWLADAAGKPEQGLTPQQWSNLILATTHDFTAHADNADDYVEINALEPLPTITKPDRVFSEHRADLANGIVALPKDNPTTSAVLTAWVLGKLHMLAIKVAPGQQSTCRDILSTSDFGCSPAQSADLDLLKPNK